MEAGSLGAADTESIACQVPIASLKVYARAAGEPFQAARTINHVTLHGVSGQISFQPTVKHRYSQHPGFCSRHSVQMSQVNTGQREPLKILTFTTLYPNREQPRHGIFIENRVRELRRAHPVDVTVVAPVPWFPFRSDRFGHYGKLARVASREERDGVTVHHPRYLVLPKIGMNVAPTLMYRSIHRFVKRLHEQQRFDVIDGHFFYPDGVVAARLGRDLGIPVMNTARGSDVALYTQYRIPRRRIRWAVEHSQAPLAVCDFLARRMRELAPEKENIAVVRNGVDLEQFREQEREQTRERLQLGDFTLLSVGNLIELKGHHLIIEALRALPDCELLIAGEGELRGELERLIEKHSLDARVRLLGLIPHDELQRLYSAADCLVLASRSEGWANVLLESMACGTPVVATRVGGTEEVVGAGSAGVLLEERTPEAIINGVRSLRENYPARERVRDYASGFSWQETADNLFELATRLAHTSGAAR